MWPQSLSLYSCLGEVDTGSKLQITLFEITSQRSTSQAYWVTLAPISNIANYLKYNYFLDCDGIDNVTLRLWKFWFLLITQCRRRGWWYLVPHCSSDNGLTSNRIMASDGQHPASWVNTMQCHYNSVNFLPNPHNRHPIARPWGPGMGFLLWVCSLMLVLLLSSQCHKLYLEKFNNGTRL